MAATGMLRIYPWVDIPTSEAEALTLESVKLLVGWGVDVNAANNDGRNALDAARSLGYASVIQYLVEKGAQSDRPVQPLRARPKF
jgi:ankyrin repeat protein